MKCNFWKAAALLTSAVCTVTGMLFPAALENRHFAVFADGTEYQTYTDNASNVFHYIVLEDGTVEITSLESECTDTITIPSEINGLPVTSLGESCMAGTSAAHVILPDTLRTIGTAAFYRSSLEEITVPEGVADIHDFSFYCCYHLKKVTLPDSLCKIGSQAFWGCSSLNDIHIPESAALAEVNVSAFTYTAWIRKKQAESDYVVLNDILIYAGEDDAVIPENASKIAAGAIGEDVFTVKIPHHVTKIDNGTFSYLSNLEEIYYEGTEAEWNAIYETTEDTVPIEAPIVFAGEVDLSKGDADANCEINVADASAVLDAYAKRSAGIAEEPDDILKSAGDVNENDGLDIEDATAILSYYAQRSAGMYPSWDIIVYGPAMQRPVIALKNYGSSVTVEWMPDSQADGYEIYRMAGEETEASLCATVSGTDVTTYQDVNLDADTAYTYSVRPYRVRNGNTQYGKMSRQHASTEKDAILNAAELSPHDTFVCYDCTESTDSTEVLMKFTLSDADKKILDAFAAEHFTADMTREEQLYTTMEWIHDNVDYAYAGEKWNSIVNKTLTDAVFNDHLGQCLQYNGAMASMMAYLGYDVNLIFLRNSATGWQHFTCRVHINGKTYRMETGNKDDGLGMTFLEPVES